MSHVVEATYEDGVLRLEQPLPLKDRERVHVTVESLTAGPHSILDIRPVSLSSSKFCHRWGCRAPPPTPRRWKQ